MTENEHVYDGQISITTAFTFQEAEDLRSALSVYYRHLVKERPSRDTKREEAGACRLIGMTDRLIRQFEKHHKIAVKAE